MVWYPAISAGETPPPEIRGNPEADPRVPGHEAPALCNLSGCTTPARGAKLAAEVAAPPDRSGSEPPHLGLFESHVRTMAGKAPPEDAPADRVRRFFGKVQHAARRALVTAGMAGLLAVNGMVVASAFAYAMATAAAAADVDDDDDDGRHVPPEKHA